MNITGRKPHLFENIGCVVIVIGIMFLLLDGGEAKAGAESNVLLGDMIALASSVLGFKYFSSMKEVQQHTTFFEAVTLLYIVQGSFYAIVLPTLSLALYHSVGLSVLTFTDALSWTTDPWMILYVIFVMGTLSCILANGCYILSLKYYKPESVTNLMFLEPAFGQMYGCFLGLDNLPGLLSLTGFVTLSMGSYSTTVGGLKR